MNQDDANFWVSDDGQKFVITAAPYSVPPTAKPKSCRKHKIKVCQTHVWEEPISTSSLLFYQPSKWITGLWLIVPHTLMSKDHLEHIYHENTVWKKIDKRNKKRVITTSAALHQQLRSVLEAVSLFTSPFIRFLSLLMCLSHSPPPLAKNKQRPKISYQ